MFSQEQLYNKSFKPLFVENTRTNTAKSEIGKTNQELAQNAGWWFCYEDINRNTYFSLINNSRTTSWNKITHKIKNSPRNKE